ncbi:helix-turn-helix domain-containing protein [Hymenobacter sp.]|uniref:winged helix-turn-helix transcriptional regulator n=1 Tax=Hymenobacter sp. TaxID=1898978 RepID=UPI00286A5AE5|nr:helix-turn-helix domain-containing protein [Hymenobacter sp.]
MTTRERKTPEDLDCGLRVFGKVLGAKWKPRIMDAISQGCKRPSEIHRRLAPVTPRVLDMQLSELEAYGLVAKRVYPGFPLRVKYFLTEMGVSALPIIKQMDQWGTAQAEYVKNVVHLQRASVPQESMPQL